MNTFETFEITACEFATADENTWMAEWMRDEGATADGLAGYYYWFCEPGCLPDGEAIGPYANHHEACAAAHSEFRGGDEDRYSVIVGNIGEVETTNDRREASTVYNEYVRQSKLQTGRASGEDVTIMDDGEPIRQYYGKG